MKTIRLTVWFVLLSFLGASAYAGEDAGKAHRQKLLKERMLQHFSWGTTAPVEWIKETDKNQGARWDFRAAYISGSVTPGTPIEEQWYFKYGAAEAMLKEAPKIPTSVWWTWYALAQSAPAYYKPGPAQATPVNAKNAETMRLYFESVKKLMQLSAKYPDTTVMFQIEPDEWGHLWISGDRDPKKVDVKIGSCGMEELKGLSDDLFGYAAAFERLRDKYAPMNVLLGCNPSGWDWQGTMSGAKMGELFKQLCPGYEFAVFETGDRDKSAHGKLPPYNTDIDITGKLDNHIKWISEFHKVSGLYVYVWQVAMGNTIYAACDGSDGHHMDNLAQMLLEDYPKNPTIARYVQAGCAGFIFQGGQGFSTASWDAKKDGITNPSPAAGNLGKPSEFADDDGGYIRLRVSAYYKQPFPILGKATASASGAYNPLFGKARKPAETPTTASSSSSGNDDPVAAVATPEPAKSEPSKTEPAKAEAEKKPAATKPVVNAAATAEWKDRLRARLKTELSAGKTPRFQLKALKAGVVVKAFSGDDELQAALEQGGQMNLAWAQLQLSDCANLALAILKEGTPADHALAAYFLLADGRTAAGEEHLTRAGAEGSKIRTSLGM